MRWFITFLLKLFLAAPALSRPIVPD